MTTGKTIALTRWAFVGKVMSLLFNMLSRLVIAFLPRSKHLSISWLQSQSAVILELKNINSLTVCVVCPSACYLPWNDGTGSHDHHFFECWVLSQLLLSSFTLIKRLFSSSSLSAIRVVSSAYLRLSIFLPEILISAVLHSAWHFTWYTLHISKVTIHLFQFGTSPLFHVWLKLLLLDLYTDFSGGRSGSLVFPSLEEFSTVCCDPNSQRLWRSQ